MRAVIQTGSRWPQPDFMPAPLRPGWLIWLWLLVSVAVLAALAVQALALREQAFLLKRLTQQQSAPAGKPLAGQAKSELQRQQVWAVAHQLDADWVGRWTALEQALPPGLQLQALEMDGKKDGQTLRLEGLAPSADPVMQLVDRLALQAREISATHASEVVLTRLQRPEGSDNKAGADEPGLLRFELVRRRAAAADGQSGARL
jgi:Tfp pilus assembly protein PilN